MMFGRASLIPNLISLTTKTSSNRAATLADGVLLYYEREKWDILYINTQRQTEKSI